MSILRNKLKNSFSQIPNEAITDKSLSANAFRILAYLFSRPDNWEINNADIKQRFDIKQDHTLAKYWKELLASGWIERERIKQNGKIAGGYNYHLIVENPHCEKTHIRENTTLGENHTHNKTELNNNTKSLNTNTEKKAPNGAPQKKQNKISKKNHLIEKMACDFDVAYSHLSDPKANSLQWGAAAAEKIQWSGKEFSNLSNIRDALQKRMSDRGVDVTDENTLKNWRMFLEMAINLRDDFLNRNFTPSFLYSQFNSIILKLNQNRNGAKFSKSTTIISDETKRAAFQELIDEGYFDNQRAY